MKRLFFILGIMLVGCFSASAFTAEEISDCIWKSKSIPMPPQEGMTGSVVEQLVFSVDGTVEMETEIQLGLSFEAGKGADIFMKVQAKGKYLILGNLISIKYDPETMKLNFTEDDIRIKGMQEDPSMESMLRTQLYQGMSQMGEAMKMEMGKENTTMKNVVVTEKTLTCNDEEGQEVVYTKKKLKKK